MPFDELIPAANTNADKVLRGDGEVVTSMVPFLSLLHILADSAFFCLKKLLGEICASSAKKVC